MTEMTKLFDDIEMPLCEVLASMEFYGVKADAEGIKAVRTIAEKYRAQTGSKFAVFFSDIRKMTGIKSVHAVKMCPELLVELENRLGAENVVFMDRKGE